LTEKKPKGKPDVKPEIKPFAPAVKGGEVVVEVAGDAVAVTSSSPGVRVVRGK